MEQWLEMYEKMDRNKYRARKTVVDGIAFASKLEAKRFVELKLLRAAGKICDLSLQFEFQIVHGYVDPDTGEKVKSSTYVADFVYLDCEEHKWIAEDTKGVETKEFRLKWKLVKQQYPGYSFREIRNQK